MTKRRAPLTAEHALSRIAGQLPDGYETMAALTQRSSSIFRKYSDPYREEDIPIGCAITLDLAYQAHGGEGYPLHDLYSAKLDMAQQGVFAERFELLRKGAVLMKEGGEAHAAIARACLLEATEHDREEALRELAENFEAIKPLLAMLGAPPEPRELSPP
jgi:hypothetical protein